MVSFVVRTDFWFQPSIQCLASPQTSGEQRLLRVPGPEALQGVHLAWGPSLRTEEVPEGRGLGQLLVVFCPLSCLFFGF